MPIHLDDVPLDVAGSTLGEALDAARDRAKAAGRIVVEVHVQGQRLSDEELRQRRELAVGDADVRMHSADMREMALTTLEQLGPHLADARAAQAEAADLLQRDDTGEAMKRIGRAMDVWKESQRAVVVSCQLLGVDLHQRRYEGRPASVFLDDLVKQLVSLRDLIVAGDTVGLADALAYEWPEMTDRWERLILELRGWIGEGT